MKLNLEINNITQSPVEDAFFISVAEKTLAEAGYDFLNNKDINISLALVSPAEIQKLNKERRQVDSVTDILSFAEYESMEELKKAVDKPTKGESGEIFLGELILCYDDIKEYAQKENIALNQELANVVSHGVLHLLGFEHGDAMFEIQNRVKNSLS